MHKTTVLGEEVLNVVGVFFNTGLCTVVLVLNFVKPKVKSPVHFIKT